MGISNISTSSSVLSSTGRMMPGRLGSATSKVIVSLSRMLAISNKNWQLKPMLMREILFGSLRKGGQIVICVKDGCLAIG